MMNWHDILYFSKGERRALSLLTVLIAAGSTLLIVHDKNREKEPAEAQPLYIVHPEHAPAPIPTDRTERPAKARPLPGKVAGTNPAPRKPKPDRPLFTPTDKFPAGTLVELNTAETATLKKVPGIGSTFAGRIVKYRSLLGGFYSVSQLREVYGIDETRFLSLENWFYADTSFIARLPVNHLSSDALARHPYLSYSQARVIRKLCSRQGGLKGWDNLRLLEEFTEADRERLSPYLSFQ
jgi:hypothetical protein